MGGILFGYIITCLPVRLIPILTFITERVQVMINLKYPTHMVSILDNFPPEEFGYAILYLPYVDIKHIPVLFLNAFSQFGP